MSDNDPVALKQVRDLLREACGRSTTVQTEAEWTDWVEKAIYREWVFLICWSTRPLIFCWGSTAGEGKRLRFSGLMNQNIVGKYEYRIDFLMMKKIFGEPTIEIFEYNRTADERADLITRRLGLTHPWYGFRAKEAGDLTKTIFPAFQKSKHWLSLSKTVQTQFIDYMNSVYFAKRRHPRNSQREYLFSDSLDSDFLAAVGKGDLIPSIEAALDIKFPKKGFKIAKVNVAAESRPEKDLNQIIKEIETAVPEQLLAKLHKRD